MVPIIKTHKENQKLEEKSSIVDFYHGKNIFITGASGFIGKVCNLLL